MKTLIPILFFVLTCPLIGQVKNVQKSPATNELTEPLKTGAQTLTISTAGGLTIEAGATISGLSVDWDDIINTPKTLAGYGITDAQPIINLSANQFYARGSTGAAGNKTVSDFGLSLLDDDSASAARTTLGLGAIAILNTIDLSTNVTGILADANIASAAAWNAKLEAGDNVSDLVNDAGYLVSADIAGKADKATTISAGAGLTGGGNLSADRTISLNAASIASLALADTAVQPARTITAGTGLTGGGDLSANRTISLSTDSIASLALADTAIQNLGDLGITASTAELNYVKGVTSPIQTQLNNISGAIPPPGSGGYLPYSATTAFSRNLLDDADAGAARTTLGLGSLATKSSASLTADVSGILPLANGGTGATSASAARTNLGLAIGTNVQAYNSSLAAISAGTWTGANSITTLGTITTGTWQGTPITDSYIASAATWNAKIGGTTGTTDNAILRADGTGGGTLQSSLATITDAGEIAAKNHVEVATVGRESMGFLFEAIEDPQNSSVDALVVRPKAASQRFYLGTPTNYFFELDLAGVNRIANAPASFIGNVEIGRVSAGLGTGIYRDDTGGTSLNIHNNYVGGNIYFHAASSGSQPDDTSIRAKLSYEKNFTVYGSHTSKTNNEGIQIGHDGDVGYIDTVAGSSGGDEEPLEIRPQVIVLPNLPTSSAGLPSGALWNDGGTLKVAP